jgi:enoyl-CoA hydratase
MIVAAKDAAFSLPEVSRGLIASAGGLYRLPRAIPRNIALELIATGGKLSAVRAYALGMVNRLGASGAAVEAAIELASEITANAPIAVAQSLAIARRASELLESEARRLSDGAQQRVMLTEDFKEGPRAFLEKRATQWRGQ